MATNARDSGAGSKAQSNGDTDSLASQLGLDRLAEEVMGFGKAMADRGVSAMTDRLGGVTEKVADATSGVTEKVADATSGVTEKVADATSGVGGKALKHIVEGDSTPTAALKAGVESVKDSGAKGVSSVMGKLSEAVGGGGGKGKGKKIKVTNIVDELDLPVPRNVAYDAFTQFAEFPNFMKKVENVEQKDDVTLEWKAQIFWSHRSWTASIVDQVPNERIVWTSKGDKGHVDGAVTFHELTPDLTRMLVNLEYYPQGLFERTGNLWRAPGRRVRLELKHFRRHLTNEVLMHQDDVEGWRGEIHEGEVTKESPASEKQGAKESPASEKQGAKRTSSRGSSGSGGSEASRRSSSNKSSAGSTSSSRAKTPSATSRPRTTAKKSTSSGSSTSRQRPAAKKSSSASSSSRGSRAQKSASSSSRSRS
jgi:uncharacterized membrane protein